MKIVLSRKGFDSSSGGCPNPVFPDGRLLALPIPDAHSTIRYRDIPWQCGNLGTLVHQLTRGRVQGRQGAHLDPDVLPSSLPRMIGWRPLFGQMGAAQGHLTREGVGEGDLFLFFGLFRPVEKVKRRWRFVPGSQARHRIWGWFQVGEAIEVSALSSDVARWANYHPHCRYPDGTNNRLYIGADSLRLEGRDLLRPGAGCFSMVETRHCLSAPESKLPSRWRLPQWFYPGEGQSPLSYHGNRERWRLASDACYLTTASRGQEFVLHTVDYPDAKRWARELIVGN